jgi:hypothetical protein
MIVETDELLNLSRVAEYFNVLPSAVANWKNRPATKFPEPLVVICGTPYWHADDLYEWGLNTGRVIPDVVRS